MNLTKLEKILYPIIENNFKSIEEWIESKYLLFPALIYNSMDIRNSGFKIAPVDVNFFPAGFNNISDESRKLASLEFKKIIGAGKKVILIGENHDRNVNYLKNLLAIKEIIDNSGNKTLVANFINSELKSFTLDDGKNLEIDGIRISYNDINNEKRLVSLTSGFDPDVIIINNDMSDGYPTILQDLNSNQKIFPNPKSGWFNRRKYTFFKIYKEILDDFSKEFNIDPWLLYPITQEMNDVDFKNRNDLDKMRSIIEDIVRKTQEKYDEYNIKAVKPYCFVKSNTGTYGMGVINIDSPDEIINLNKKARDDMNKGKSGVKIDSVIIQEGITTIEKFDTATCEKTIYLVNGSVVGGFFRCNQGKNSRISLNSKSSFFKPLEKESYSTKIITLLSRIAYIAAMKENNNYHHNDLSGSDFIEVKDLRIRI